jgi:hypothetical protein
MLQSLTLDTSEHNSPSTRFTKKQLEGLSDDLEDADRAQIGTILQRLRESLLNPYYETEIDRLIEMLSNDKFKLREIRSTTQGILMKLVPSTQKGGGGNQFHYTSVQIHSFISNGKRKTRKNVVRVNGKKGTKSMHTYNSSKKRKTFKTSKRLTATEIANIRRGKFMPGLFRGL